ncbi:hypothetical protein Gotri_002403, partial [Gossypium trilobum]|nr:hypothetical protein [Gossypium trilobum]
MPMPPSPPPLLISMILYATHPPHNLFTMPTRSVKIIQLQHPDTTSYGSSGAGYSSSWFSRLREKMKEMTFFNWVEMFLPCCRWIRTYKWREYLQVDLMAGTTVGIMLVPQ